MPDTGAPYAQVAEALPVSYPEVRITSEKPAKTIDTSRVDTAARINSVIENPIIVPEWVQKKLDMSPAYYACKTTVTGDVPFISDKGYIDGSLLKGTEVTMVSNQNFLSNLHAGTIVKVNRNGKETWGFVEIKNMDATRQDWKRI
ncbi:MAG: hypothetical protein JWM56_678 [Candidatus Peribacteria bacterium]|nr:hypothetical protein [Candidatus Peribacteria bacterium]